jgi:hypothetical protein
MEISGDTAVDGEIGTDEKISVRKGSVAAL